MADHKIIGDLIRDPETLDIRAVCSCGQPFEANLRETVLEQIGDHLIDEADWAELGTPEE